MRHIPEAGAVCGNSARTDLCGGRGVTSVPTATLDPFFVIPADISVHLSHELVDRYVLPVSGIEQLRLESAKESLASRIVRRTTGPRLAPFLTHSFLGQQTKNRAHPPFLRAYRPPLTLERVC